MNSSATSIFGAILQITGTILFTYYGWVAVIAVLGFLIWQNRRRERWVSQTEHVLLLIEVPKDNEKKELSAEQMFASLHGILRSKAELRREGAIQEHISYEIASIHNKIQFYVWVPKHLKDFVEGQIYAQYPTVRIKEGVEDYVKPELGDREAYTIELDLAKTGVLPIKTFQTFEVDPLAGITAVMAKLEEAGEEMWIQILARPIDDNWQNEGVRYIEGVKSGRYKSAYFEQELLKQILALVGHILANMITGLFAAADPSEAKKGGDDKLSTGQQAMTKAVEEKITKLGYLVKIRVSYVGSDPVLARRRIQAIVGGFKQFNTTNLNGFVTSKIEEGSGGVDKYRARLFVKGGSLMNIEELASVYHLPHMSVETPNMVWTTDKTSEPPANLPSEVTAEAGEVSLFAATNFRGEQIKFGIKRRDRGRHLYIIGQTGTGKSKLLNLLALSDIYHNQGMAIIDPHGDFATDMLQYVPEHRLKDVIYFNPTDRDFPIAFNPLEVYDEAFKNDISSEMVGVLKRMFDSWGPRLEYILRFTLLALLDYPDSTMLGITRMLTDKEFRKRVIKEIKDPVVKAFWVTEFASWNDKFANEAVAPVLNKVGAFTANPLIRNIVGQPNSRLDLRKIMDEGKILVVNLSRGQIGEDNASVLGALMVTKIQLAAMSRANVPMEQRRPFYLYVDEFQNFATDSFATILSEARKYALNLTVANQYVSQMPEEVRNAVFGNVGSIVSFRVGVDDAPIIAKSFAPIFEPDDVIKLNNQHIFLSMSIDGEKALPFSAKTLRMPDPELDYTPQLVAYSREHYASARADVEVEITDWALGQGTGGTGMAERSNSEQDEAAGGVGVGSSGGAGGAAGSEQKANEFLGALKNPAPPVPRPTASVGAGAGSGSGGGHSAHSGGGAGGQRSNRSGGGHERSGHSSSHTSSHRQPAGGSSEQRPAVRTQHSGGGSQSGRSNRVIGAGEAVSLRQAAEE